MAAPTRIQVRDIGGAEPHGWVAATVEPGEYVDAQSYDALRRAASAVAFKRRDVDRRLLIEHLTDTSPAPIDRADVTREVVGAPSLSGAGGDPSPKLDDLAEGGR